MCYQTKMEPLMVLQILYHHVAERVTNLHFYIQLCWAFVNENAASLMMMVDVKDIKK